MMLKTLQALQMVNIICMKWGTKYPADYVNKLHNMVARHLTLLYRFVCLTDDGSGIDPRVEVFPIPKIPNPSNGPERGWTKLVTFSPTLYDLQGATLFLDLDIIITGNMDEFFNYPADVAIIAEWNKRHGTGNSSVYRFNIGAHPDVLDHFSKNMVDIQKQFRNEQAYLSHYLTQKNALSYWPSSWCLSFKRHCMHYFPLSLYKPPAKPAHAKVVIFHGHPHPDEAIKGITGKWYRTARPAPWVKDAWQ